MRYSGNKITPILISVRKDFARAIVNGDKKIEFRRRASEEAFRPGTTLYIYSTVPDCAVIGSAEVAKFESLTVENLTAAEYLQSGCIGEGELRDYFIGVTSGYAIHLCNPLRFGRRVLLKDIPARAPLRPPMSYTYIDESAQAYLRDLGGL
ncbi:MAG: hypothetical protein DU429_07490 [Candidatus Tokpelaia sp.]|nr:MAG: hypothetical protein DU430_08890 [Candidatus Tokpelaia sp.]KAA6205753.1 MAG: hypothetical protein DU429_07490 [Candidatus Tokpelaia sp.]